MTKNPPDQLQNAFFGKVSRGEWVKCSIFLPKTSLRRLYHSLIYPYFYYRNIVWAAIYNNNLRRLDILQKRIIINKSHFNAHTDPILKELGFLRFNDIH